MNSMNCANVCVQHDIVCWKDIRTLTVVPVSVGPVAKITRVNATAGVISPRRIGRAMATFMVREPTEDVSGSGRNELGE